MLFLFLDFSFTATRGNHFNKSYILWLTLFFLYPCLINAKDTLDTHCLMGCITCGTTYSVILEAISSTGYKSECRYRGFSSSEDTYIHVHTHKNIHTGAYLRVWGEGWMIRWDNWCKTICFCNFKGSEQWFGIIEQKFTRTCKHIVQRT